MRVSVVINTGPGTGSLDATLQALRHQTHPELEVIVLDAGADTTLPIRVVACPDATLGARRNLGVDAAAGEVVAFTDAGVIPEARWLERLVAAYDDDAVAGAGGPTFNHAGVHVDQRGANCSFRRSALEAVAGFDEESGSGVAELCARMLDAGLRLRTVEDAAVHGDPGPEHHDALEPRRPRARRGRAIAPADPNGFLAFGVLAPEGRRLSVCFVSQDYPPRQLGGIGRFTHDLARGFAAAGHDAHVVTRDDEHPYRVSFEEGVWVHRFPVGLRWIPRLDGAPLRHTLEHAAAVYGAIDRVAERAPIDVVAGSLWAAEPLLAALSGRWATTVACNTPMRKVAELQPETAAAELTPHQIAMEDALLRSPAVLQPVSHENARLVKDTTDKPLHVIWHGVADRRDDFPRTRADDDAEVRILFAGRLEPRKGIDTLLEAAAGVLRERPEASLVVLGGDNAHANGRPGVFADWVRDHAADVADRIDLRGHVTDDELYSAYADCDVFCAPSRYESFGLVHVEAMMMGRPVIAGDVGGMRETVVEGETGRLVAPGDPVALRAALEPLVADAGLRERMGAAGRARYEAEFRNEVAVARNVALFESLEAGPACDLALVLRELCGVTEDVAREAAGVLLDPERFPVDHEAEERRAPEPEAPRRSRVARARSRIVSGLRRRAAAARSGRF